MTTPWILAGAALLLAGAATQPAVSQRDGRSRPALLTHQRLLLRQPDLAQDAVLEKARVGGKYSTLLRQIQVTGDAETYGPFSDYGRWEGTEWAGFTDLPPGYWVYVAPNWYIWRDLAATQSREVPQRRDWGPEQATGAPDTFEAGDIVTAWASLSEDDQEEWLMLEYGEPVLPSALLIHESFNPGAISKVSLFNADGKEVEVWKGTDPVAGGAGRGLAVIPLAPEFKTNRVKITLNSPAVPGWNEIDAVGLVDTFGTTHWATGASASSTYAEQ